MARMTLSREKLEAMLKAAPAGQDITLDVSSGVTGYIRNFGAEYLKAHPAASLTDACWACYDAFVKAHPGQGRPSMHTFTTQLRGVGFNRG